MSVTIHQASVRSQSAANPTHDAAAGVLHLNTASGAVFVQTATPQGALWVPVKQAGSMVVFGELEDVVIIDYGNIVFEEI